MLRAAPPEAGFAAQIAGLEAFVAETTAGLAAATLGEGIEPDPQCHAKLAQLLSRHARLAEEEAVATKAKLEAINEQLAALQAELATTKRDALAKAAANANLQRMLRQRLAETAEPDAFTAALKAGSDAPTLQLRPPTISCDSALMQCLCDIPQLIVPDMLHSQPCAASDIIFIIMSCLASNQNQNYVGFAAFCM